MTFKAKVLNDFFASVFTAKVFLRNGMRQDAFRSTTNASLIFEKPWKSEETPDDWKIGNVISIFRKWRKEDSGNYRPVSLTQVPGKAMWQTLLEALSKHIRMKK